MIKVLRRHWLPILIVCAMAAGAYTVANLRTVFGSNPVVVTPVGAGIAEDNDPKVVVLEVFGTADSAVINYLDLDGKPQRAQDPTLPWSLTMTTTAAAANVNLLAQSPGDSITCRITVDGEVKDERTATGMNAETYCLVKAA
ncbi:MmpS family transport accessory protein [[Mycobacterium] wendilense]|uniref:MmpS family transport accessory protein n=1 Tax=[Mycobacterium] wendilense TaxID=3064284 RepID=A0ABM9MIP6_9MYCO|nr:MmpS family transport accessory protein [Mycolicibacterium sp. MU0050]CAJ1585991.1 MmpS family transport accessory protein [Mycolicibacterium sp. MU0050]